MKTREKVVVAMSGGVDSSVAACLLHEQGYDCVGLFMRLGGQREEPEQCVPDRHRGCCSALDAGDARAVAGRLGFPFYALNFSEDFNRIIDYFAQEYARGRTPNPCVVCNQDLKFGRLLEYAEAIGARYVATGHYARIGRDGDRPTLMRAVDGNKDQSYVLFSIGTEALERILFPLGGMKKNEVRELARRFGLSLHDKPDSSDICFVPDRDYARVVRERAPEAFVPGEVHDTEGNVLGYHDGTPHFTIGQRRGLGIAAAAPLYVTQIQTATNTVVVGSKADVLSAGLEASRVNWMASPPTSERRVQAQIRYAHRAADASVTANGDGAIRVVFDEPQPAVTPGQAVVLYDGDVVLGGGWIDRALATR